MFEEAFNPLYCEDNGRPCKPIRRMVGLLILKHVRNVSDESVVEQWQEKNVTFPTDAKLTRKIIGRVLKINGKLKLPMRQSYKFVVKELARDQRPPFARDGTQGALYA